jgi:hypothetical protein
MINDYIFLITQFSKAKRSIYFKLKMLIYLFIYRFLCSLQITYPFHDKGIPFQKLYRLLFLLETHIFFSRRVSFFPINDYLILIF